MVAFCNAQEDNPILGANYASLRFSCLLLLAAAIPWSTAGFSIGLGLAALASLPALPAGLRRPHHPFLWPCLIWAGALLLSWSLSDSPRATDEASSYYPFFLLFIASTGVRTMRQLRWLGNSFLIASSVAGFYAVLAHAGFVALEEDERFSGSVTIFTFAMVMATGYMLCALYFAEAKRWRTRVILWLASFLMLDGILLNESRATVLAVGLGMIALFLFSSGKRKALLLFAAPVLVAVPVLAPSTGILDRFEATATELNLSDDQIHQREVLWIAAGRMVRAHPVVGVGVGNYRAEWERMFAEGEMEGYPVPKSVHQTAHSVLFHVAATMGIVGVLAFLAWSLGILQWFWRRRRVAPPAGVMALALSAIVIGFGLTDMTLLNSRISGIFALGLGAAMGVIRNTEESSA